MSALAPTSVGTGFIAPGALGLPPDPSLTDRGNRACRVGIDAHTVDEPFDNCYSIYL